MAFAKNKLQIQEEPSVSSQSRQPAHGNGRDHKMDIGDTVRMQVIVSQAAYGGLQDIPSPSGRLSDRIERLRQRCTEALGRDAFRDAYHFLKQHEEVCAWPAIAFHSLLNSHYFSTLSYLSHRSRRAMTTDGT